MAAQTFDERYRHWTPRSGELFTEASRYIPGGAGSSARTIKFGWKPYPPFLAEGLGSRVRDVDGHSYVDYLLGLGPMILGHRHPAVTQAVTRAVSELSTCFGLPYELEIQAARKVTEAVPGVELVRFSNSGSEVVGTAVRLARAHTGRRLIIRFEGHYHGWQDTVYWSNHVDPELAGPASSPRPVASGPGVPAELADTLIVLSWNDPESFAAVMRERGDQVAAVITEPAVFNTGCILPEPGYLELLRELTRRHGALLIFDEVITGFRFARGGAQEYFGVTPDLTTMAKGLGGGFPVAAIGGSREAMSMIAEGRYSHSGTYNANTIACAAVSATMDVLATPGLYERQRELGETLMNGLRKLAAEAGLPVIVEGLGTVFQLWFSERPIRNWRDAQRHANEELFTRWWQEMLLRGVLFHPSQYENLFLSLVHTTDDVNDMLNAAQEAFAVIGRRRLGGGPMVLDLGGSRARPADPPARGRAGSQLLYERVVAYVEELVAERGLVPGDLLPTYAELAATVGVSLITVRRALDELERAGRVRRHQGLGTFLARPRIVTEPARAGSLLGTLKQGEAAPPAGSIETRILDMRRGLPSPDVAGALRIQPTAPVWRLRRQRLIDGQPAVVETSIIPVALAPDLDQLVKRLGGSLYDLLARECKLEDEYEEQYLEVVVVPDADARRLLSIPPRTPVVRIRGLSMDKSGTPFDCFEQLYRATEFAFAISGSTSRQLFPTPGFQDWEVRALPDAPPT